MKIANHSTWIDNVAPRKVKVTTAEFKVTMKNDSIDVVRIRAHANAPSEYYEKETFLKRFSPA